jgi:hypothetical protein
LWQWNLYIYIVHQYCLWSLIHIIIDLSIIINLYTHLKTFIFIKNKKIKGFYQIFITKETICQFWIPLYIAFEIMKRKLKQWWSTKRTHSFSLKTRNLQVSLRFVSQKTQYVNSEYRYVLFLKLWKESLNSDGQQFYQQNKHIHFH